MYVCTSTIHMYDTYIHVCTSTPYEYIIVRKYLPINLLIHIYLSGLTVDSNKLLLLWLLLLPQFVYLGGGDYGRGGKGKDRQPVPRAKLFCLRFCGRIGFVARFTLTLDKHLFSVFGLEDDGGESAPEGRSYPIGWKTKRRAIISGITPKAAAAGAQDGWWWVGRKFFYFGWVRPGEAKWLLLYIVHCTRTVIKIREQLIT